MVVPGDEIMTHRSMAALTLLQKHIHQRDLADLLDRLKNKDKQRVALPGPFFPSSSPFALVRKVRPAFLVG